MARSSGFEGLNFPWISPSLALQWMIMIEILFYFSLYFFYSFPFSVQTGKGVSDKSVHMKMWNTH